MGLFTHQSINEQSYKYFIEKNEFINWHSFWKVFNEKFESLVKYQEIDLFNDVLDIVYEYGLNMLKNESGSLALRAYTLLESKLSESEYQPYTSEFIKKLDKTEFYYNIAYLKWIAMDTDLMMYYLSQASKSYGDSNDTCNSHDFIKSLYQDDDKIFWNFMSTIVNNLFSFDSFTAEFKFEKLFNIKGTEEDIIILLDNFPEVLLIQFIVTINQYWRFLPKPHNKYKAIKISRIINELVWLFECYLKEALNIEGKLRNLLEKFLLNNSELSKSFFKLDGIPHKTNEEKLQSIKQLIDIIQNSDSYIEKQANCLYITWLLRNYSAHNLSEDFMLFEGDKYTKKLFISCFNSFMIVSREQQYGGFSIS